jgi:predicted ester cyclase
MASIAILILIPESAEKLAEYMKAVWTAFPDFRVEVLNAGEIGPGLVAHHWMIKGTNTGQGGDGSAPTGRTVSLKGASVIQVEGDTIASDHTYFDRAAFDRQLEPKS